MAEEREQFNAILHVKLDESGRLRNLEYEKIAIRVAMGISHHTAWEQIGKKARDSNQRKYRSKLVDSEPFQERIMNLRSERDRIIDSDPVFGETLAMIQTLWNLSIANDDLPRAEKALTMKLEVMKHVAAKMPKQPAPAPEPSASPDGEEDPPARPVGRPAADVPQSRTNPEDIRKALLKMGSPGAPKAKATTQ